LGELIEFSKYKRAHAVLNTYYLNLLGREEILVETFHIKKSIS